MVISDGYAINKPKIDRIDLDQKRKFNMIEKLKHHYDKKNVLEPPIINL